MKPFSQHRLPAAVVCSLEMWARRRMCGSTESFAVPGSVRPIGWIFRRLSRAGENRLVVEVANSLAYTVRDNFSRGMLLKASGLLGPVCVEFAEE